MNAFAQTTRIKLTFGSNEIYAVITNSKAGNDFLSPEILLIMLLGAILLYFIRISDIQII